MSLRSELVQAQQHMVQNQTATMLELGTNLLNQTTAQTRKLTDVEAQVLEGIQGWGHLWAHISSWSDLCPWV